MWRVERIDAGSVSVSHHSTARQAMDQIARLRGDGAARLRIHDDLGREVDERQIAVLASAQDRTGYQSGSITQGG